MISYKITNFAALPERRLQTVCFLLFAEKQAVCKYELWSTNIFSLYNSSGWIITGKLTTWSAGSAF